MGHNTVICCDGTWNTPTQTDRGLRVPSVVKMARAVVTNDPDCPQEVYYDTGVGTGRLARISGVALGIGLTDNIK